jgi:hypothetical protein
MDQKHFPNYTFGNQKITLQILLSPIGLAISPSETLTIDNILYKLLNDVTHVLSFAKLKLYEQTHLPFFCSTVR